MRTGVGDDGSLDKNLGQEVRRGSAARGIEEELSWREIYDRN
jgi:hypothetical protein